jgi:hypothetical protein
MNTESHKELEKKLHKHQHFGTEDAPPASNATPQHSTILTNLISPAALSL